MISLYDEVGSDIDKEFLDKIYGATLGYFGLDDQFEIEVSVVDEDTIQSVNKATRGIDKVTDVLSFPTIEMTFPFDKDNYQDDIDWESGNVMLGDIMLCEKRAKEQALEYGHSYQRECGYLLLHGLLHLMGFDHIEEKDKVVMREHEEKILTSIGIVRE